jgi:electron transfer flavoprotein beta subunit
MGADRGILVETDMSTDQDLQSLAVAKSLQKIVEDEKPDLVIVGKQAIDSDSGNTGPMLAGLLGWPQVTFASKLEFDDDAKNITATREVDAGLQTLKLTTPAVITTDLRLNEPRYATLPNIMKARKKKIAMLKLADLGIDFAARYKTLSVEEPATRAAGVKVASVEELIEKLDKDGLL